MSSYPSVPQMPSTQYPVSGGPTQQNQQPPSAFQPVQQPQQQFYPPSSINKYLPPGVQPHQQQQQQHQQNALNSNNSPNSNAAAISKSLPPQPFQNNILTNGGSSHSSRTASPSLNYSQNVTPTPSPYGNRPTSNYMPPVGTSQQPNAPGAAAASDNYLPAPPQISRSAAVAPSQGNIGSTNVATSSSMSRSNQNLSNLSNSMQNLSIQQSTGMTNGRPASATLSNANLSPGGNMMQRPMVSAAYTSPTMPTSTTSTLLQQPMQSNRPANPSPMSQPMQSMPVTNPGYQVQQAQLPPPPTTQYSMNNNQPVGASPLQQQPFLRPGSQQHLPPPPSSVHPPPSSQHHQQQQQQPPQQQFMPPGSQQPSAYQQQQQQPSNVRKPMYPSTQPPMSQPNQSYGQSQNVLQQQQQPQQQQPRQGSTFNGYPNSGQLQYQNQNYQNVYGQMSVAQQGFSKLWGHDNVDLMQHRHILPTERVQPPPISLNNQFYEAVNCSPEIMRCTINKIPESNSLLQKSRLPLGILIHPFRDMTNLVVINCPTIVRCRLCRTYINPFVHFVDSKMWKCNLCYRINELPEDFQYDPVSKTYGEVTRRPEVRSSTIEFIAPSEYMLRPPQPAIYLFLLDVSIMAQQCGYLEVVCDSLSKRLESMPGDARTKVGFIAYNSEVHFYSMAEGFNQPHEITLVDIDDIFLPCPDNLLVNVKACKDLIKDLLSQLPQRFANSHDSGSALGAALQVAFKLMSSPGGRITVFQCCLPSKGPGALQSREDPNNRSAKEILHLNPATDFYKRLALDCSGQQIAIDLYLLNQQYSDLATLSGMSKYSGGCIYHFPLYQKTKPQMVELLRRSFDRYLTRKIGFEAVMRLRCTRGLQIHTFHGNFFVRSTDLLSLPNVNPDAGYGMQLSYEEGLTDVKTVCFQAALLYTTSSGERRIRVHTMCLPVTNSLTDVLHSADAQCIIGLLAKMGVDRSLASSVSDARDAFINATVDIMNAFKLAQNLPAGTSGQLIVPKNLSLLPLYISSIMKHVAFRTGTSTRLDDRVNAMDAMKTMPLDQLMKYIYPEFYHLDALFYSSNANENDDSDQQDPPLLQLSAEFIDSRSMFLIDCGTLIIIYVGINVQADLLQAVLGVSSTAEISDYCYGLPTLNTPENESLHAFIESLNENKPFDPIIQIIRDTSTCKSQFFEKLVDDRSESTLSYYEFLQHLRTQVK